MEDMWVHSDSNKYINKMTARFLELIDEHDGEEERPPGVSDDLAFRMIMDVLMRGIKHEEATHGICSEDELLRRHREYTDRPIIAQYLVEYPLLHLYFTGSITRPKFLDASNWA